MNSLKQKHKGFVVSFEVMMTLVLISQFLTVSLYTLRVMNVSRYMNTVMTSTAEQASRWGGTNTNAYKQNVDPSTTLLSNSQTSLNTVAPDFSTHITGSPSKITHNGDKITIKVEYRLPSIFNSYSKVVSGDNHVYDIQGSPNRSIQVSVYSIMRSGNLL